VREADTEVSLGGRARSASPLRRALRRLGSECPIDPRRDREQLLLNLGSALLGHVIAPGDRSTMAQLWVERGHHVQRLAGTALRISCPPDES
jgi:hypothetical protein